MRARHSAVLLQRWVGGGGGGDVPVRRRPGGACSLCALFANEGVGVPLQFFVAM